ncbi:MAG: DMT family transporter [Rhizobiaceae bacterium]
MSRDLVRGMVLMVIAMLMLPMMDAIAKILAVDHQVSAAQTTFGRFLVQAALLAPIIIAIHGVRALVPWKLAANLLRGAIMSLAVMVFFATLKFMPIADALAIFFLEPFILTILSVIVLKEAVGWKRGIAVLAGFAGAMLIVQPSYAVFGPVSLMPMITATLFAVYLLLTRQISGDDNPLTMQFVAGIGGVMMIGVVLGASSLIGWDAIAVPEVPEPGIRWILIFGIGVLATVGHLLVVMAFRLVSASILAPFQYLEIVSATILGYWLFNDFPDALKWVGIAIIVGSGIYLFLRERRLAAKG